MLDCCALSDTLGLDNLAAVVTQQAGHIGKGGFGRRWQHVFETLQKIWIFIEAGKNKFCDGHFGEFDESLNHRDVLNVVVCRVGFVSDGTVGCYIE